MAKVLVTGANKGIDYGICKYLGKSGWQVNSIVDEGR